MFALALFFSEKEKANGYLNGLIPFRPLSLVKLGYLDGLGTYEPERQHFFTLVSKRSAAANFLRRLVSCRANQTK